MNWSSVKNLAIKTQENFSSQSVPKVKMKAFLVCFVTTLVAFSDARWLKNIEREKSLGYDQQPVKGNTNMAYSSRIINGQPANIANFPYMLALLDLTSGGRVLGC